jgi:hypothetical protein
MFETYAFPTSIFEAGCYCVLCKKPGPLRNERGSMRMVPLTATGLRESLPILMGLSIGDRRRFGLRLTLMLGRFDVQMLAAFLFLRRATFFFLVCLGGSS